MRQQDGSIKIGWNDPYFSYSYKQIYVVLKFKDGGLDIVEIVTE